MSPSSDNDPDSGHSRTSSFCRRGKGVGQLREAGLEGPFKSYFPVVIRCGLLSDPFPILSSLPDSTFVPRWANRSDKFFTVIFRPVITRETDLGP